ncbi:hypothetical protein SALBM217S_09323 [Streptomyces griseoloalbus]
MRVLGSFCSWEKPDAPELPGSQPYAETAPSLPPAAAPMPTWTVANSLALKARV